jgi:SP family arabinose:H+ symporter-like MFS transporter
MAIATFTIWTSCYIVAQTFPMLNDSKVIGPVLTFWTYGVVSLLTFLFVLFVVPETKGRTLEEIELAWRQNG